MSDGAATWGLGFSGSAASIAGGFTLATIMLKSLELTLEDCLCPGQWVLQAVYFFWQLGVGK